MLRDPGASPVSMSVAEIMKLTKPLAEVLITKPDASNTEPLFFCVDETSQQRRNIAELIATSTEVDKQFDLPWCIAGVEAAGGDMEKAREWLSKWAPTQDAAYR